MADSANPLTVPKVGLHLFYGNYTKWHHCCWRELALRALFACERMESSLDFYYYFFLSYIYPQELFYACLIPKDFLLLSMCITRGWANNEQLGVGEVPCVQTRNSHWCHPERCLTSSCLRTRCVYRKPQHLSITKWKQTHKRLNSSCP